MYNSTTDQWHCVFPLQAAQTGMWPQPSITLGTGKPKTEPQSPHHSQTHSPHHPPHLAAKIQGEIAPEEKIKQVCMRLNYFELV